MNPTSREPLARCSHLPHDGTPRSQAESATGDLERWHWHVIAYWGDGARGWAPEVASTILERSRLDRQLSLVCCLRIWLDAFPGEMAEGGLILAWTNLGAITEGLLKLVLSVFAADYAEAPVVRRGGPPIEPDALLFEQLRQFFREHVWLTSDAAWDDWLLVVQGQRNTVHAYRHRDLRSHNEFLAAIVECRDLAFHLDGRLPWE